MGPRDHPGCAVQAGHTAQGRPQDLVSRRGEEVRGPVADTCRKKTQWVSQSRMPGCHCPQMICGPGKTQDSQGHVLWRHHVLPQAPRRTGPSIWLVVHPERELHVSSQSLQPSLSPAPSSGRAAASVDTSRLGNSGAGHASTLHLGWEPGVPGPPADHGQDFPPP